jgi:hypothetical protein
MAIEIRELVITVRIEESARQTGNPDLAELRKLLLKECKKEIAAQIRKSKER